MNSSAARTTGGMATINGGAGGVVAWEALRRLREKQQSETELLLERQRTQLAALKTARATAAAAIAPNAGGRLSGGFAAIAAATGSKTPPAPRSPISAAEKEQDSGFGGSSNGGDGPGETTSPGPPAPVPAQSEDERPISAVGARLTFEELLELELNRQDSPDPAVAVPAGGDPPRTGRKTTFLKRGQGSGGGKGRRPVTPADEAQPQDTCKAEDEVAEGNPQSPQRETRSTTEHEPKAPSASFDPRQRFSRPTHQVPRADPMLLDDLGARRGLPRRAKPRSAPHPLNSSISSEASFKLTRSQWENKRAQEEEELEEFEQLENNIVPSQQPTPARPEVASDSEEEQHESGRVQDGADYQLGPAVAPFDDEASWEEHGLREFAAYNPGRTSEAADLFEGRSESEEIEELEYSEEEEEEEEQEGEPGKPEPTDGFANAWQKQDLPDPTARANPALPLDSSSPPRSRLVAKLFGNGPAFQSQAPERPQGTPQSPLAEARVGAGPSEGALSPSSAGGMSALVVEKIHELNQEIAKFKKENKRVSLLGEQKAAGLQRLRKEVEQFEKQRAQEMAAFTEFRDEEMKKLKRERRLFDRHREAARSMPDKQEREEIEQYRAEIAELRSQVRQKDEKASAASKRYKDTVKRLSTTNEELRAEVAALEQARLDEWAKRTTAPSAAQQVESRPATAPASPPAAAPSSLQMDQARARGSLPTVSWKDYSQGLASTAPREEVLSHPDGKVEKIGSDGRREVAFPNGTRKEVSPDGFVVVRFFNGDIKRTFPNQKVEYHYADTSTTHTTFPDGIEVLQFSNGQVEKHFPNGTQEISFPDQTVKYIFQGGEEETVFPDGTVQRVSVNGDRVVDLPNGQREVHTKAFSKRRYPDGTVKIVYADGRQETQYPNGRVRVKAADGTLLVDKVVSAVAVHDDFSSPVRSAKGAPSAAGR